MMYPILCKVRYESLHDVFRHREIWKQIGFSIFINWVVAPFFMVRLLPFHTNAPFTFFNNLLGSLFRS